ncbi:hypothetical protein K227x_64640 [Rubripirellula lacrimiformis]|uniref:DUF4112 domain-containing protein n=1 Tax=Rubripirellula lacrimiformis TaxID=1930273 RepID=A0A517NLM3_9BACT|nr:DUF4112 domain-containing protein [Rubripirellula lacrimiformis]QDT08034.1 hypothetical protein K227x_64640 [Rubripirellula lacrimiformis]
MPDDEQLRQIQMRTEWFAKLMDEAIEIPIIKVRLGWDSLIGFIPAIGDFAGLLMHGYLLTQAYRAGARKRVYLKMLWYALIDFLIGVIPFLGDIFDIFWKSNRRSANLLRREIARQTKTD